MNSYYLMRSSQIYQVKSCSPEQHFSAGDTGLEVTGGIEGLGSYE